MGCANALLKYIWAEVGDWLSHIFCILMAPLVFRGCFFGPLKIFSWPSLHKPSSFIPASSLPRENPLTRDFHNFRVIIFIIIIIIIIIFLSKPAIFLPEQASVISSPNVSTVDGGVHGHRAFVFLSPYIPMVDRGALPRLTLPFTRACARACRFSLRVRMRVHKIYVRAAQRKHLGALHQNE